MSWDRKTERKEKFYKKDKARTKKYKKEQLRKKEDIHDTNRQE